MTRGARIAVGIGVVLLLGLGAGGAYLYEKLRLKVPIYAGIGTPVVLEQNWEDKERTLFHHVSQGTQTLFMPYRWFMALEQATFSISSLPGLLSDQTFLDRFGFIPDDDRVDDIALPIGFSRGAALTDPEKGTEWKDPISGTPLEGIGFTCATCHTGRLGYKGQTLIIDGGGAFINIVEFQKALFESLLATRYVPERLDRFVVRVVGEQSAAAAKATMTSQLDEMLSQLNAVRKADASVADHSVDEGFARLDALNRIGNQVFSLDLHDLKNYAAYSAPVRYPHVWGSSWFDWVQYNGSIEQPMVRNAGEALGVRALVNLTTSRPLYESTVRVDNLYNIEQLLAGTSEPNSQCTTTGQSPPKESTYKGLKAPKWPETILPKIDQAKASRGSELYASLCQGCHLPPVNTVAFCDPKHWTAPNQFGKTFIKLDMKPLDKMGTDPAQATDMAARTVSVPPALGLTSTSFGPALGQLVQKTVEHWYDTQQPPTPQARRDEMNGFRDNGIRAPLAYRPRPLDGIWATAPYLHNGSVPTLYALLSPVAERPLRFQLGQREFDPVRVGFSDTPVDNGFTLDTTLRGNANSGHEFNDHPNAPGAIGRLLKPDERMDLIEYLKTL